MNLCLDWDSQWDILIANLFLLCCASPSKWPSCAVCNLPEKCFSFNCWIRTALSLTHNFGASSFAVADVSFPSGISKRRPQNTAIPGHIALKHSGKSPHETVQTQFHLHFRCHSTQQPYIFPWHDVNNMSAIALQTNYKHLLQPNKLVNTIPALPRTKSGVVFCQCSGRPDIIHPLNEHFLWFMLWNHD